MKDVFEEKKDEREGGQKSEFSFGESLSPKRKKDPRGMKRAREKTRGIKRT